VILRNVAFRLKLIYSDYYLRNFMLEKRGVTQPIKFRSAQVLFIFIYCIFTKQKQKKEFLES